MRFSLKSAPFLVASLFLLAACGGSKSNNNSGSGGSGSSAGGSGGAGGSGAIKINCQEPAQLDLNGTWAAKVRMTVKLVGNGGEVKLCPQHQTAEASLYMYLDMKQNASDPTKIDSITPHVCSVSLPVVTGMVGNCDPSKLNFVSTQLQVLDPLTKALPKIQLSPVTGKLGGTSPGTSLTTDKLLFVAGSSAQGSALPGWKTSDTSCGSATVGRTSQCDTNCVTDCSKTRDDDGDGYPGITLGVCGLSNDDKQSNLKCNIDNPIQGGATIQGKAWLDLQIDPALTGTVKSSCEVTGNVSASILYNVLGANVYLTGAALAVTDAITSLPTFTVDPSTSEYRLVRVDGKHGAPSWNLGSNPSQACQAVLQHKNDF